MPGLSGATPIPQTPGKVDPGRRIRAIARGGPAAEALARNDVILKRLCNVEALELLPLEAEDPANSATIVVGDVSVFLPLEGMVDIAAEVQRLTAELTKLEGQLARTEAMLGNKNFVERARADVVERERKRLVDLKSARGRIRERLATLAG